MIKLKVTDQDGQKQELEAHEGDTLMEALREHDWGVSAICGGMCSCGTCHVYLRAEDASKFPPVDIDEEDLVDMLEFTRDGSRLSCQLTLSAEHNGVSVELAPEE